MDNYLLQSAQAYTNYNSQMFYQPDPTLGTGYIAFAAPFKSFVWDSGVNGAVVFGVMSGGFLDPSIPTVSSGNQPYTSAIFPQIQASGNSGAALEIAFGDSSYFSIVSGTGIITGQSVFFPNNENQTVALRVSGSGSSSYQDISFDVGAVPATIYRGQDGVKVDFVNGRIVVPSNLIRPSDAVSGTYSFKEFNIYFANQAADRAVFTNKFYLNSRFARPITGIPPAYDMVTPCIFLSNVGEENNDWSIGGKYDTTFKIKASIMAENMGQLEGAMSYFRDSVNSVFPQLETNAWPLNSFGDLKSGYNYQTILSQYSTPANQFMVTDVRAKKVSDSAKANESLFLGEVTFTVSKPRYITR